MRVHKKNISYIPGKLNNTCPSGNQTDYKMILENLKTYVVFKISITTNLKERLAYLDVLEYIEKL